MLKIITTSSLIPRNGLDTLIKACAMLKIDWELTIAGDGPLHNDLENLAIKLGIINRVKFLGRVPSEKIPELLKNNDLFVRPSRAEGFGNSFIEAMATGVPVIGTPVGGIVDFLISGETGLMVPVDNPKELALAIDKIYRDKAFTKKIINQAQKKAQEYDWDIIAPKVLKEMYACL
ncbi:MAG: glycosyltransferase family 4 protein [Patescibacteria group bacterium]